MGVRQNIFNKSLKKAILLSCFSVFLTFFIYHFCYGWEKEEDPLSKLAGLKLEDLMKLEVETIYSASKFIQKTTEAPSYVSIITSSDIKRYGYRTLADIIKSLSGFYISHDRNYHYLGVRGFSPPGDYNTRVLLLIDGHRINDNIYNTAYIGNEFILDVDLIERVEVIRGPSSSIYGSNAFFGIINVITKKGKDINKMEISGEAGSFDTYKQRLTFGKEFNKDMDILLSASFFKSHGQSLYYKEFDNPAQNNGWADGVDGEKYNSFFLNTRYLDFNLQGGFITREKIIPTAPWGTEFNSPLTNTTDTYGYLNLKFKKDINKDTSFMSRLFYNYYYYDGNYLINKPPFVRVKDQTWGKSWGTELQYNRRVFEKHLITSGFEYQDNFLQKQRNYDESSYVSYLNDRRNSYQWGIFLQDEFTIFDNLILNAGIRHDYFKFFHGNTSPRAALIYKPLEKTALKFLYGEAFRVPNMYELYYNDGNITQKTNPDLDPEKIKTYEIVLEQYYKNFQLSLSGFYYKVKNLITLTTDVSDGLLVYRNIDEVEARGIEFEVYAKWQYNIETKINYTFQQATDKITGRLLVNSPKHLVKSNLFIPIIKDKLSGGFGFEYSGSRKTLGGRYAGGAFITNLNILSQNILKGLEISGTIYNILDKKYGFPASGEQIQQVIEQDGRCFRLKLTYSF